jgi:ABC-2 type transport system ATP-binding protein
MNVIQFSGVHQSYKRGEEVLKGTSLSVSEGEVVGLLGRNGAGKTTLIRIAMGMLAAQKGTVELFGLDPRRRPLEVKRQVGYVSEEQIIPDFLHVEDVIRLHRKLYPTWDIDLEQRLRRQFEIPVGRKIKTLSKGQSRQVSLLCAIAHRPGILLLDEPAGGLDPAVRRDFLETAIRYLNESGSTILFSSHYMGDVERLASRIAILHRGVVFIDHDLDQLREEFSLALMPIDTAPLRNDLLKLKACLSARKRLQSMHAVFHLEPSATTSLLEERFGVRGVKCQSVGLEEIFIELTGGRS